MKFVSLVFILSFVTSLVYGQVTSSSPNIEAERPMATEVLQSQARFNQITAKVGDHFRKGLSHLENNRRSNAREEFDKTIEVFLFSNVNVQSNQKLRECYSQLTETIYRIEFPASNQLPNIRSLSATCGLNIDNGLADKIAKIVQTTPIISTDNTALVTSANNGNQTAAFQGFTEQKFEGSKFISSEDGYSIRRDVTLGRRLIQSNQVNSCQNSDSPVIQGLRLDTPISLIKRDSKLDFSKAKKFSVYTANDSYSFISPNKSVGSLFLTFYKNNIMSIGVYYSSEIRWSSLEEFRQKIVDTLGISGTWETVQTERYGTRTILNCKNFGITLTKGGEEYSLLSSSNIVHARRIKDMTEASKEKAKIQQHKKETFKP
jgi:hypothetical protein